MLADICRRTEESFLLAGPEPDANRPARLEVQRLEQADRFEHHTRSRPVVGCAGARVPGIEVRADHHHFVLELRIGAGNFADDVERRGVFREEPVLHVEFERHRNLLLDHARDPSIGFLRHMHERNLRTRPWPATHRCRCRCRHPTCRGVAQQDRRHALQFSSQRSVPMSAVLMPPRPPPNPPRPPRPAAADAAESRDELPLTHRRTGRRRSAATRPRGRHRRRRRRGRAMAASCSSVYRVATADEARATGVSRGGRGHHECVLQLARVGRLEFIKASGLYSSSPDRSPVPWCPPTMPRNRLDDERHRRNRH